MAFEKINKRNWGYSILILSALIALRALDTAVFYDPIGPYFRGEFQQTPLPYFNPFLLFLSTAFRYYLNSLFSMALIYVWFPQRKPLKFSALLFITIGSLVLIGYLFILQFFGNEHKMLVFQLRRFLAYPILVMIFLPALYYQKKQISSIEPNS
ncbi:MAG: exosortase F system-associated protein [Flavobacterium sp. BFFFF2]|nr:MAG: exosortase F system-associated protein [Flavobacterium sp. BFFFF2]